MNPTFPLPPPHPHFPYPLLPDALTSKPSNQTALPYPLACLPRRPLLTALALFSGTERYGVAGSLHPTPMIPQRSTGGVLIRMFVHGGSQMRRYTITQRNGVVRRVVVDWARYGSVRSIRCWTYDRAFGWREVLGGFGLNGWVRCECELAW